MGEVVLTDKKTSAKHTFLRRSLERDPADRCFDLYMNFTPIQLRRACNNLEPLQPVSDPTDKG